MVRYEREALRRGFGGAVCLAILAGRIALRQDAHMVDEDAISVECRLLLGMPCVDVLRKSEVDDASLEGPR